MDNLTYPTIGWYFAIIGEYRCHFLGNKRGFCHFSTLYAGYVWVIYIHKRDYEKIFWVFILGIVRSLLWRAFTWKSLGVNPVHLG